MGEVDLQVDEIAAKYESWYEELGQGFHAHNRLESDLVTSVGNRERPIHRWYVLKESFSGHLPVWIVQHLKERYSSEISKVLDPFVGGGTTGIALAQIGLDVDGLEYNPFIHLAALTKSQYPQLRKGDATKAIEQISLAPPSTEIPVPGLVTLSNGKYFRPDDVQLMLYVLRQIHELDVAEAIQNFLLLGVATSIERVANLRKDGRALRYTLKAKRPTAREAILQSWYTMLEDLEQYEFAGQFRVQRGTAIDICDAVSERAYDLVVYSPPYLNNFDYSEVYKLELWLLGFITNRDEWIALRRSTVRSHPSVKFDETRLLASNPHTSDIYEKLAQMKDETVLLGQRNEVGKVLVGYFDDMYMAFREQWRLLKPGGFLAYIVANSRHRYLPIATDVILGEIATRIGFEPLELIVLRKRNGRTRHKTFLRESVVFLRKPFHRARPNRSSNPQEVFGPNLPDLRAPSLTFTPAATTDRRGRMKTIL